MLLHTAINLIIEQQGSYQTRMSTYFYFFPHLHFTGNNKNPHGSLSKCPRAGSHLCMINLLSLQLWKSFTNSYNSQSNVINIREIYIYIGFGLWIKAFQYSHAEDTETAYSFR